MTRLTTGETIAKALVANGVDTVFGIPGAHMYDFNDALARESDRVRFIHTRHEQGAAYMAYGYAKSTGRAGVYTVVPGPGFLNSGAALCTAYGANTPVLCVTGNIMSHLIGQGRGQLHELPDHLATMRGLTKWAERINHPAEAARIMEEAFRIMQSGRQRPVAVEAPWDVFGMAAEVENPMPAGQIAPPIPDPEQIKAAVEMLRQAKNPLVMVGSGAIGAKEEIRQLAELLQVPVAAHRSGKGIVSDDSDYALSPHAAWKYWKNCDLLIGIGSRLELQYFRWRWLPPGLKTIRLDIDPTEMVRLKPTLAIVTDAKAGTQALISAFRQATAGVERPKRQHEFATLKADAAKDLEALQPQANYLSAIRDVLPRDSFFVEEISQIGFAARLCFPVYEPRQYVTCGYQDNLGFGFNTALGVKVANPDKAVVSVSGDGGFMFGVQELATARQFGINVVSIVFNNNAYGNVRRDQQNSYGNRFLGADLHNPDFVQLAESFGVPGYKATTPDALRQVLASVLKIDSPAVIEVQVPTGSEASPWPFLHPAPPT
ncbi:acetolactate synthase-1/2/3 large subunit [Rhizobium sp. ERR 922]|uniref:thiamine pyrophosphate-dependent enzyme n=1 Tax=unclassified Rhizobium TaxID=2613769 RepID=UPI0011A184A5|nr:MULTISPECIES: thiamine pyrophosphate-dependent enzyme [unclassified Rhizobium]TWB53110.1 acetolactate synthase-1/2/3 large subunit [Rhizobium sp. ERR 922]TWB95925.1 acetolactate synthase-1/2/3 large subunit [Rhizobium sp. ERR 942]